jgi:hypothetical protein
MIIASPQEPVGLGGSTAYLFSFLDNKDVQAIGCGRESSRQPGNTRPEDN